MHIFIKLDRFHRVDDCCCTFYVSAVKTEGFDVICPHIGLLKVEIHCSIYAESYWGFL